jgi:hypothetical protein
MAGRIKVPKSGRNDAFIINWKLTDPAKKPVRTTRRRWRKPFATFSP